MIRRRPINGSGDLVSSGRYWNIQLQAGISWDLRRAAKRHSTRVFRSVIVRRPPPWMVKGIWPSLEIATFVGLNCMKSALPLHVDIKSTFIDFGHAKCDFHLSTILQHADACSCIPSQDLATALRIRAFDNWRIMYCVESETMVEILVLVA